ncbi:uncharacterized protein V1518DRAFT_423435 [Limtongia smithiae]|uniref:uncharacterized protein n=1 Tax=Limtongia smithiae TaxID=1125753 RepID=UPI0034CECC19
MFRHAITCHVLDTISGRPAPGIRCTLAREYSLDKFVPIATAKTDSDGRVSQWQLFDSSSDDLTPEPTSPEMFLAAAAADATSHTLFRVTFAGIDKFYNGDTFFPYVDITFTVPAGKLGVEHFHIPLLLSRYSYSTYRGS